MSLSSGGFTSAGVTYVQQVISKNISVASTYYLAIGTGTTAFNKTDTTLGTELTTYGLGRASASITPNVTTYTTSDTFTLSKTFTYSGSATVSISEVGSFTASSGPTLIVRGVLSPYRTVATSGDTYTVNLKHCFPAV